MAREYIGIILKLCSLGLIIGAAGLWAGAGVDSRPKYRDEQTIVGGTIWSQLIIPMGLLLSEIVEEKLDSFVNGYFLITGVGLCWATGIVLILEEFNALNSPLRSIESRLNELNISVGKVNYDRIYLGIGVLSLMAGALTFAQFLILII